MFQQEHHFINKRIQKPRRLNMKCIAAVNSVHKTNRNIIYFKIKNPPPVELGWQKQRNP
jgi:hypothetical protein